MPKAVLSITLVVTRSRCLRLAGLRNPFYLTAWAVTRTSQATGCWISENSGSKGVMAVTNGIVPAAVRRDIWSLETPNMWDGVTLRR